MSLGNNRDFKTADRRARTQLAKHYELMQKYIVEGHDREKADKLAYQDLTAAKKESK